MEKHRSIAFTLLILIASVAISQTNAAVIEKSITELSSESFRSRQAAQRRLIDLAAKAPGVDSEIQRALADSVSADEDLEGFLAARRVLRLIRQHRHQQQLDRFLHDRDFDRSQVSGWSDFSSLVGDDMDARLLFKSMSEAPWANPFHIGSVSNVAIDLDHLQREDSVAWAGAIYHVIRRKDQSRGEATQRLISLLRSQGTGPVPHRDYEQRVISRMVAMLLDHTRADLLDRIVIGLRYECFDLVEADCRLILNDATRSPASIVAALLAASKIDFAPEEIDQWLNAYQHDARVSHVWRSMVPPRQTYRTQVADVATVLLLHRRKIDPRESGFKMLIADPVLVFRPYSLGFDTDGARQDSRRKSAAYLSASDP